VGRARLLSVVIAFRKKFAWCAGMLVVQFARSIFLPGLVTSVEDWCASLMAKRWQKLQSVKYVRRSGNDEETSPYWNG